MEPLRIQSQQWSLSSQFGLGLVSLLGGVYFFHYQRSNVSPDVLCWNLALVRGLVTGMGMKADHKGGTCCHTTKGLSIVFKHEGHARS